LCGRGFGCGDIPIRPAERRPQIATDVVGGFQVGAGDPKAYGQPQADRLGRLRERTDFWM
jgi:hypothetical protein